MSVMKKKHDRQRRDQTGFSQIPHYETEHHGQTSVPTSTKRKQPRQSVNVNLAGVLGKQRDDRERREKERVQHAICPESQCHRSTSSGPVDRPSGVSGRRSPAVVIDPLHQFSTTHNDMVSTNTTFAKTGTSGLPKPISRRPEHPSRRPHSMKHRCHPKFSCSDGIRRQDSFPARLP